MREGGSGPEGQRREGGPVFIMFHDVHVFDLDENKWSLVKVCCFKKKSLVALMSLKMMLPKNRSGMINHNRDSRNLNEIAIIKIYHIW